jgi:acetoin utilization deacetylase AcuC-like enzyme
MVRKLGIIRDERYLEHKTGLIHPEHPNRLIYIHRMLDSEFSRNIERIEPKPISLEALEAVHSPAYVKKVLHTAGLEFTHLAQDTPSSPRSYMAAWLAAGGCLTALDTLASGRADACFAMVRPPGHHAQPDRAGGFCIFNNLGVAARSALSDYGYKRILIIDWDIHHGNGIQDLFYDDERVMYISSHFTNIFPYMGEWEEVGSGSGEGYNLNLVLTKNIEDNDMAHIYRGLLNPAMERFRPDLVMVAAGFDLHRKDIFSRAKVTEACFARITNILLKAMEAADSPPLLLALEGGYRIPALVSSTRETLKALTGYEEPEPDCRGTELGEELLSKARKIHSGFKVWTD